MKDTEPLSRHPSRTKIVATVGPASDSLEKLIELIQAGVDVFRINTAHGERADHQRVLQRVREASRETNVPVATLIDLSGPKIRLGELPGGQLECGAGTMLRFVRQNQAVTEIDLETSYEPLIDDLEVGNRVMLADGTVSLIVEQVEPDAATCRVIQGGILRSRQGVNLPGVRLSLPSMTDGDRQNALWAAEAETDFLSLSFVRTADDILQLRSLLQPQRWQPQIVAKVEKPEAVANLDAIVAEADAIMVARGDLGVEMPIARVPVIQKRIIAACRQAGKPVIVATQMLESMHHSRLPTRAETSDVANAILDGADACMLSGETAVGKYPREAVSMMQSIAVATQTFVAEKGTAGRSLQFRDHHGILDAVATAAGYVAEQVGAKLIVVATTSGRSAIALSKNRNFVNIVGVSESDVILRRMALYWGVLPLRGAPTDDGHKMLDFVVRHCCEAGILESGDRIVLLSGTGVVTGHHDMLAVHRVG